MDKEQILANKARVIKGLNQLVVMAESDELSFFCGVFACPNGETGKFIHGGGCTVPHIVGEMHVINTMLTNDFVKEVYPSGPQTTEPIDMGETNGERTDH